MFKKKMPDFDNLGNNGTASLDLELGLTYHNLVFQLGGTTFNRSHIKRVRALINGKAFIRDIPATILHADNLFKGSKDAATFLVIDFEEARSRAYGDQILTAIGTAAGVNSFKIEFDIEGATAPTITTIANVQADLRPLGAIPAFIKETYDAVSTGVKQLRFGYTKESAHVFKRVHFHCKNTGGAEVADSTLLNSMTLVKNGINVWDRVSPAMNRFYQEHYEDVPQDYIYTVDFVEDNNTTINLMPTADANSLYWEPDFATTGHLDIYYSMVTALERL